MHPKSQERRGQVNSTVVRVDERGERIPLTIAETYPKDGLTKIIFQEVGHHEEAAVHM
ncbi:MAG: hypothetical protein WBZ42_01455 [Halobacteriota archaeon]